jgi:hypothetical protein
LLNSSDKVSVEVIHHKGFKIWKQSPAAGISFPGSQAFDTEERDARESFFPSVLSLAR